jgi:hypothetical protein
MTLVFGAVALLALAPAPASALAPVPRVIDAGGSTLQGPYADWIRRARVPGIGGRISVRTTGCPRHPALVACVVTNRPRTIWLRPDHARNRRLFLHELGHVFDLNVLARRDRLDFRRIHRLGSRRWYNGLRPPSEWFAEGYADCAARRTIRARPAPSGYDYSPTPRRHRATCELIDRAAARARPDRPTNPPPVLNDPLPPQAPPPKPPERVRCWLLFSCAAP